MPGLDSNAIYSMRCSCFRKGLLQSINVIPLERIVDIGLDIIRHRNLIISRQGQFLQAKCSVQFSNLRKRDRMPTSVNIRISSTSFVKVFTAYGSSICFGGFCLPPVTPYMSCPKELTSRRTRWEYSVVISCFQLGEYKEKHLVLTGD